MGTWMRDWGQTRMDRGIWVSVGRGERLQVAEEWVLGGRDGCVIGVWVGGWTDRLTYLINKRDEDDDGDA